MVCYQEKLLDKNQEKLKNQGKVYQKTRRHTDAKNNLVNKMRGRGHHALNGESKKASFSKKITK